jgi:hypothetical protein
MYWACEYVVIELNPSRINIFLLLATVNVLQSIVFVLSGGIIIASSRVYISSYMLYQWKYI